MRDRRSVASGGRQRDSNADRARRSRLLTDASLVSSMSATSRRGTRGRREHEHRALLRREMLQADDERERDRLLRLVARLRSRASSGSPPAGVLVGLQPEHLAPARRLGHLGRRPVRAAPARAQGVERAVGGDPVQPRADRRAFLELLEAAPRGEQRLLEQVLGVLRRADDPVDVQLELTPVRVGQRAERGLVAARARAPGSARSRSDPRSAARVDTHHGHRRRGDGNSPLTFARARAPQLRNTGERRAEMARIVHERPAERVARRSGPGP